MMNSEQRSVQLGANIRFLRKSNNLSQEKLAGLLGVKRSSIAAYESKNVEPRLKVVLEIAKLFNISVRQLVHLPLGPQVEFDSFEREIVQSLEETTNIDRAKLDEFVAQSMEVKKILEGLKAFHQFKQKHSDATNPNQLKQNAEVNSFIELMEHLLDQNESVINVINKTGPSKNYTR